MELTNNYIFLDGGSNFGQGYEKLKQILNFPENIDVHMFEPNIKCYEYLKTKYINNVALWNKEEIRTLYINNVALWNKEEIRTLNIEFCPQQNDLVGGATNILHDNYIKPNYISSNYMNDFPPKFIQETKCIRLSDYMKKLNLSSIFYLKLDIEGAEIEVLQDLIETDMIKYIKKIIIEWHFHMRKNYSLNKEYFLEIFDKNNIEYIQWY